VTFGFQWGSKASSAVPTAMPLNLESVLGKMNFFSQPKMRHLSRCQILHEVFSFRIALPNRMQSHDTKKSQ
jgi:hypothetical protein